MIQTIDYDLNGKVIEDITKVKVPREMQIRILNLINGSERVVKTNNNRQVVESK